MAAVGGMELEFTADVIEWRGPAPFVYAVVPEAEGEDIAAVARALTYGWGMVPTMQAAALNDEIVVLDATEVVDVRLYWQQWGIRSPALDKTTDALIAAGRALR